jgi:hypothetical protein
VKSLFACPTGIPKFHRQNAAHKYSVGMKNLTHLLILSFLTFFTGQAQPMGTISLSSHASGLEHYAALELQRYLYLVTGEKLDISTGSGKIQPGSFILGQRSTNPTIAKMIPGEAGPQGYILKKVNGNIVISGSDPEGVLYGVYGLLEDHYGVGFYLGGDVIPETRQPLIPQVLNETRTPAVAIRGFLPWTNFPQSATSYSWDDWKFIIDQMAKMRLNFLHIHNYNGEAGHNEMFHNFSVNGIMSRVWMATAGSGHGWACPGWNVNEYRFGASDLFGDYDFGADCALHNETLTNEQVFSKGVSLFQRVIDYAHQRGVKIGLGLDIDLILRNTNWSRMIPKSLLPRWMRSPVITLNWIISSVFNRRPSLPKRNYGKNGAGFSMAFMRG